MPKHALSFVELHNQFFMQGSNLGSKVNAAQRGAKLLLDDERGVVWVLFKGKVSFIPLPSVASADVVEVPGDVQEALGVIPDPTTSQGPPAVARARREAPETAQAFPIDVPMPHFDPNDADAAAKHRELVRAASANSNRPDNTQAQNDLLIQQARVNAMGIKNHNASAQVQNAHQVGDTTPGAKRGPGRPRAS